MEGGARPPHLPAGRARECQVPSVTPASALNYLMKDAPPSFGLCMRWTEHMASREATILSRVSYTQLRD